MPPRGRKRARCARLGGPVPGRKAGSPAARGEAPPRAFVRPRGPPRLARPLRAASPAAPQSAPAWAWGLTAALRGFLPSGDGSGLGGRERVSEGSWVGTLSHLGQVPFSDPQGSAGPPGPGMRTGPSTELAVPWLRTAWL